MGIQINTQEFELYKPGLYRGRIADVVEDNGGAYGPQLKWAIKFPDLKRSDGESATLHYWTGYTTGPKSNLKKLADSCGLVLPKKFDTDILINRELQALVVNYDRADGSKGTKISSLLTVDAPPEPTHSEQLSEAAALTAAENAKIAAIEELKPSLAVLMVTLKGNDIEFAPNDSTPGLKALQRAAKAQKVEVNAIADYSLVSLKNINLAREEADALVERMEKAEGDPFEAAALFADE